jgi:hypothetical protein
MKGMAKVGSCSLMMAHIASVGLLRCVHTSNFLRERASGLLACGDGKEYCVLR